MKKIKLLILCLSLLLMPKMVFASNGSIRVTASNTNVKVGDTVNITVTIYAEKGIGAVELSVQPTDMSVLSGSISNISETDGDYGKTITKYFSYKAIKAGTSKFQFNYTGMGFTDNNTSGTPEEVNASFSSDTVTVSEATYSDIQQRNNNTNKKNNTTKNNTKEEKSTNNYLKDLTIEGIELLPVFSKEEENYNIEIDKDTKEITINAVAEDNNAEIEGIGKVNVNIGDRLEVIVTAPSGDIKKYIINVLEKKEEEIITVKINNIEYTVINNKDLLTIPDDFKETTIKINGKEVLAFINKKANITLVGLKDSKGNINLYIYKNKKYTLFKQLQNNNLNISVLNYNKKLYGFTKSTIKINKKEYPCYVYNKNKNIIILYGTNLKTGKNGFYQYDKKLNTLINYNKNIINDLNLFKIIGLVATIAFAVSLIFNIVMLIENKKIKKKKNNS